METTRKDESKGLTKKFIATTHRTNSDGEMSSDDTVAAGVRGKLRLPAVGRIRFFLKIGKKKNLAIKYKLI
jgi:hypothetical protein